MRTVLNLVRLACVLALFGLIASCSSSGTGDTGPNGEALGGLGEQDLNAQREARYGLGSVPTAEGEGMFRDVRFGFDSSEITDVARLDIEYNTQILKDNPSLKIQLEGHTDERGTVEYNLALGQRRASAVRDLLVSYGVPASRLTTISYGEEMPLDPAHTEEAWAKNRRVHFSAFTGDQTAAAPAVDMQQPVGSNEGVTGSY